MKVTVRIPDDLINEVNVLTHGKNITESLIVVLREWSSLQKIKQLKERVRENPLSFKKDFSARKVREINRQP